MLYGGMNNMKISCQTNLLNKAIQIAQRAISSRPSTPIFSGLHLIAKDNKLTVQAMDLNIAISSDLDCQIEKEGEIVVSSKHFSELMRKMQGEYVSITKNEIEKTITLKSGNADFQLILMNEDDYPKFPKFEGEEQIVIKDSDIKELIKKTIFSCSTDEARPLFTGILVEIEDNVVTFVGTNTHRLAIKSIDYNDNKRISVIIPSRVLNEISRNLNNDIPQDIKIVLLNNQLMVLIDNIIIVSRIIEGKFPDYRRVVPATFALKAKFNVKQLAGAVERVSLFSTDGDYSIIKICIKNNEIIISSSSPDVGKGKEIISCHTEGDEVNVAFNAKYVLDILKNLEEEEAIMGLNNSLSPVMIRPIEEKNYTYIVTPVRVVF